MAKRRQEDRRPEDDRAVVQNLFASIASEDPEIVRGVLRENPALAEAVLGPGQLQQMLQALGALGLRKTSAGEEHAEAQALRLAGGEIDGRPGVFTELTRELSPDRAAELYRKVVPLVVYELLRTLDQNAQLGTVQRVVDHLCSREVQARLRACAHVRDGMLDELAKVLCDQGVRTAIHRADVHAIMQQCGVMGELMTLVNCIRLTQAAG